MSKQQFPLECRFCAELRSSRSRGREYFRCRHGRFDVEDRYSPGRVIPCSFAWSGIWKPSKTVAAAQKGCPYFKLHPQVLMVNKKDRPPVKSTNTEKG